MAIQGSLMTAIDGLHQPLYLFLAVAIASYVIYQFFFSSLAGIPGPFAASFSRWWIVKAQFRGDYHRQLVALHKKHGNVVRIAPDEVSLADPAGIKQIYGSGSRFTKSDWYSVWRGHRKFELFAAQDSRVHAQQRKLTARAFAMETLKDLESYVDNIIEVFMQRMNDQLGERVDIGKWLHLFAFDVIGEITWSKSFGFLENGHDEGAIAAVEKLLSSGCWVGQIPWLYWIQDFLMPYIGNHLGITTQHGKLREFVLRETDRRREKPSERMDMIGRYLEIAREKPDEFGYIDVISMGITNINAASETTAVSMRSILYYTLTHPEVKEKLMEEIDSAWRRGELSDPVTFAQGSKMPYLQAVIYEALRIHPAMGMTLPRIVPPGGAEISGKYFPEGTIVGMSAWVIHQNEDIFGKDPDQFRPERWLMKTMETCVRFIVTRPYGDHKLTSTDRYFFSFGGSGSRSCIGKNISFLEMNKTIPTLFLRYDLELANPEREWTETCKVFVLQKGLYLKLTPRKVQETS